MKWFATGQRIEAHETFEKARLFASGYLVADNRIDILDAWWMLRLPNWVYEIDPFNRRYGMAQKILIHSRQRGFWIILDFEAEHRGDTPPRSR